MFLRFPSLPRRVWYSLLAAAVVLLVLGVLYLLDPLTFPLMPQCPFRLLTGFDCPGCGIQRALHAFLHGRWAEAWAYNRFLIYSLPYLFCLMLTEWVWQGERRRRWQRVFEGREAVGLYVVLFVVWGIVRNVLGI